MVFIGKIISPDSFAMQDGCRSTHRTEEQNMVPWQGIRRYHGGGWRLICGTSDFPRLKIDSSPVQRHRGLAAGSLTWWWFSWFDYVRLGWFACPEFFWENLMGERGEENRSPLPNLLTTTSQSFQFGFDTLCALAPPRSCIAKEIQNDRASIVISV